MVASRPQKLTSVKNRPIIIFFGSDVKRSCQVLASIETINTKFLPDGTIYLQNHPRKCIQIQI